MDDERAEEILSKHDWHNLGNAEATDMLEYELAQGLDVDGRLELADALDYVWRRDADAPGFQQPPATLVRAVENLTGLTA